MNLGPVTINFQTVLDFFTTQSIAEIIYELAIMGGWLILFYLLLYAGLFLYVEYKQQQYMKKWKWVLLAVGIPLLNVQTPKAVEQMFAHLVGAYTHANIAEKFHEGLKQRWFTSLIKMYIQQTKMILTTLCMLIFYQAIMTFLSYHKHLCIQTILFQ